MRMPNGFGAVCYLGKNRRKPFAIRKTMGWEMVNGKAKQIYKYIEYFATREEAIIGLAKLNNSNIDMQKIDFTFANVFDEWWEKKNADKAETSKAVMMSAYRSISNIHEYKVRDITEDLLQDTIDEMDKGYSAKSLVRKIMNGVMEYAVSKGIRPDNPASDLSAGKITKSTAHKPITDKDLEVLKNTDEADAIVFLCYTGLRLEELCEIRLDNIHLDDEYLIGGIKTVAGTNRTIPIHKSQIEFVRKQMNGKNEYLFEFKGKKMRYRYFKDKFFTPVMDKLGMDYTPHDTRHTFITNMRKAGVDILLTQRIVGHSQGNVTESVYTHVSTEELVEAVNKLK